MAVIVTACEDDGAPYIAFVFVEPGPRGTGVASALIIRRCMPRVVCIGAQDTPLAR